MEVSHHLWRRHGLTLPEYEALEMHKISVKEED